ncbi:MAG: fibronectin type III domain-containing protein, partial [Actinomycetota bacterium]
VVGSLTSGRTYHCMVREQVTGDSPYEGPLSGWSNDIAISYTTPGAPTAVSAARVASQTVRVSFTPPSNGGATINDYDVQYSTSSTFASGVVFSESGTTTGSSVDVTGLTNGTTYYFRVRATNLAGDGPWSPISNGAKPYTTPGVPTAVSAGRVASETVRVSFTAPGNGGSAITDYDVQYSTDSTFASGVVFSESGTTTGASVDVSGLTNGTTYYFRVRATNAAGDGPWSNPTNGAIPYTTPDAPVFPFAERLTGRSGAPQTVRVSFYSGADGGSAVTDYDIQYSTSPTFASGNVFYEGGTSTATTIDVTGLAGGTVYYFRVRATNAAGNSSWSTVTNGTKP